MLAGKSICYNDSSLLFFILTYLLLFYDNSCLELPGKPRGVNTCRHDSSILFFILVFLILFY